MNNPRPPMLVIFDCDGVLVDSEPIASRILAEALTEIGFFPDATTDDRPLHRHQPACGLLRLPLDPASDSFGGGLPVGVEHQGVPGSRNHRYFSLPARGGKTQHGR